MQDMKNDLAVEAKIRDHKTEWDKKFADEGARLDQLIEAQMEDVQRMGPQRENRAAHKGKIGKIGPY